MLNSPVLGADEEVRCDVSVVLGFVDLRLMPMSLSFMTFISLIVSKLGKAASQEEVKLYTTYTTAHEAATGSPGDFFPSSGKFYF